MKHCSISTCLASVLSREKIANSVDGKGSWRDNVLVERLWRSIKYEEIYLHTYDSVAAAKAGIARYIEFYNSTRPNREQTESGA